MDKDRITKLFDELVLELGKHNYESENDVYVPDLRDDVIILNKKWLKFCGEKEE